MTLRVIGLSYEIYDSKEAQRRVLEKKDDDETKKDATRRFIIVPSTWEAFNYCYSFIGLFTGPYYTYQTYYDAMHSEHLQKISVRSLIVVKLKTLSWTLPTLIGFYILGPVEVSSTSIIPLSNSLLFISDSQDWCYKGIFVPHMFRSFFTCFLLSSDENLYRLDDCWIYFHFKWNRSLPNNLQIYSWSWPSQYRRIKRFWKTRCYLRWRNYQQPRYS